MEKKLKGLNIKAGKLSANKQLNLILGFEGFEGDEFFTADNLLILFASLIKSGLAWRLQGSYGRQAKNLIDNGYINSNGEILKIN